MTPNNFTLIPISLGMVNCYLLMGSNDQSVLVDCGVPGSDKIILKKLGEIGVKPSSLKLILITHGHADHMGSVSALREATGAKTAIHTNDAGIIRTGKNPPLHPIKPLAKLLTHISGDSVKGRQQHREGQDDEDQRGRLDRWGEISSPRPVDSKEAQDQYQAENIIFLTFGK
jgi:glyoxylase-like metal-dependent hydrolase (beta-lactamase superfamily II)